jgi:hypothetical protein
VAALVMIAVACLLMIAVACLLILWGVLQDPNQLPIPM